MATALHDAPVAPVAPVPSPLADLRAIPLEALRDDTADEALRRLMPEAGFSPVPVASFQSSL